VVDILVVELIFLIIIFLAAEITHSVFFYLILIVALLLCLPAIYGLRSAPYVPTLKKNVETMFKFASIKPGMKIYDLGAGDGRLVERAAKKGANAVGYEISLGLVACFWLKKNFSLLLRHSGPPLPTPHIEIARGSFLSALSFPRRRESLRRINSVRNLSTGSSRVYWGSLWSKDISDADVVMCFLMPNAMKRFEKEKFPTMKKGAKFISNIFPMPGAKPTKHENNVYLYVKK